MPAFGVGPDAVPPVVRVERVSGAAAAHRRRQRRRRAARLARPKLLVLLEPQTRRRTRPAARHSATRTLRNEPSRCCPTLTAQIVL